MGDPDFVVVDGVPVMLPSYDEAVSSSLNALAPGYSATVDQGHILQTEDQSPPAYPGPRITDMLPSEFESCESQSGSSELLQSLYSPPACQAAVLASSDRTDASRSTAGEAVSTSPRIDITDETFKEVWVKIGVEEVSCTIGLGLAFNGITSGRGQLEGGGRNDDDAKIPLMEEDP
ncbi:hypothetical protein CIB84_013993 [Bambusicola thoracicus]|uniref:Uncharacterized protein n=1 Tax=Bambusicola thoracicus TaxID=9083 RepID=A0A2P4SDT0_BAMTH|nr:hypothetical protein CIB84_013993 [Bambusicola thoracicus]